jgi:hypothetical protein
MAGIPGVHRLKGERCTSVFRSAAVVAATRRFGTEMGWVSTTATPGARSCETERQRCAATSPLTSGANFLF